MLETYLGRRTLDIYVTTKRLKSKEIRLRMVIGDPRNFTSFIRQIIQESDLSKDNPNEQNKILEKLRACLSPIII